MRETRLGLLSLAVLAFVASCATATVPKATEVAVAPAVTTPVAAPSATPLPASPPAHIVRATASSISLDGEIVCTANTTLVGGYGGGCSSSTFLVERLATALESILLAEDGRNFEVEVPATLPLVAFFQVNASFLRASVSRYTLVSGGERRAIANRRDEQMLALHLRGDDTFRVGIEQGAFALAPVCPKDRQPIGAILDDCIAEMAKAVLVVLMDFDALPSFASEKRTFAWLWSVLVRMNGSLRIALG